MVETSNYSSCRAIRAVIVLLIHVNIIWKYFSRGLKDLQGFHMSHRNRHCQGMMELEKNLEFICSETAPKNALFFLNP